MKKILLAPLILLLLTGCSIENDKEESKIIENDGMLSYTIDGEKTDIKPTNEDGYIVNKILCDNGSDLMWDNDNWEVELTKVNSKDRCKVDFTKDTSKEGYRVTVTSNMTSSLDSLSKATTLNGTIIIYSTSKIESVTGCNGIIEDNKVIISNITQNQTCNIEVEDKTLAGVIKSAYPPQLGRTDFSVIDNGAPALYIDTDDQGATYYFSGDGTNMNNWVKFADKWWRIIRINGNGSVRLLYAGDGTDATDIGYVDFIEIRTDDPIYVGWKYGTSGSLENNRTNENISLMYTVINDNWYKKLDSINKNYIDTKAIYCNDRELASDSTYSTTSFFDYAARKRLDRYNPSFICNDKKDQFKDGFGLITADELVYAGGIANYGSNNTLAYYYLNNKAGDESICTGMEGDPCSITDTYRWLTMTPMAWWPSYPHVATYSVYGSDSPGMLGWNNCQVYIMRPVISLKKEVLVTGGDGSGLNPYTVKMPD